MAGYWPRPFLSVHKEERKVLSLRKKKTRQGQCQYPAIGLVNLFFIITKCQIVRSRSLHQHRVNYICMCTMSVRLLTMKLANKGARISAVGVN